MSCSPQQQQQKRGTEKRGWNKLAFSAGGIKFAVTKMSM